MDNISLSFELKHTKNLESNINNVLVVSLNEILKERDSYCDFETHNKIKNDNIDRMIDLLRSIKIKEM